MVDDTRYARSRHVAAAMEARCVPGLGVPCREAQADGVPCDGIRADCEGCERSLLEHWMAGAWDGLFGAPRAAGPERLRSSGR